MRVAQLLTIASLAAATPAYAGEPSDSAQAVIRKAMKDCNAFENGRFSSTSKAIARYDINGDGRADEIIDAAHFACSTAASMWGGTGGTMLWVVVDGKGYEFLAHRWQVVDIGKQRVLLLAVHHSECGEAAGPCYRAHVWSGSGFRTTRQ